MELQQISELPDFETKCDIQHTYVEDYHFCVNIF